MASYLLNRRTATTIGNNTSSFKSVKVGVAQGSKLGPLHFIAYINDLLNVTFCGKMILYADDAVLTYVCDSWDELQQTMQSDAHLLNEWLSRNVLTLNVSKTKYMTFGRAKTLPELNINYGGEDILRVRQYKYLGLVIDENLSFKSHVDHVKKLIVPFISLMWRNGRFIPLEKRKQIYFALVQSYFLYDSSLRWMRPV